MSGLLGKTETLSNVTPGAENLQNLLLSFISGKGLNQGLFGGPDTKDLQPFLDLFSQQNERNLAQAKESVGTLTGSSLGNILGRESANAATSQGAFLTNFAEQRRNADTAKFLQALQLALTGPAAGVQNVFRPGLLDSLSQGAIGLAQGGAFNGLLGATA